MAFLLLKILTLLKRICYNSKSFYRGVKTLGRFCDNCGAQLNEGVNFCSSCGKRLIKPPKQDSGKWFYETFLRRDGRLKRWRYFKRTLLAILIESLACVAMSIILVLLFPVPELFKNELFINIIGFLMTPFIILINAYLTYNLIIRRCHDLSQDSWLHRYISKDETSVAKFLIIVPILSSIVSVIFSVLELNKIPIHLIDILTGIIYIYLIFAPSEVGTNEYGEYEYD